MVAHSRTGAPLTQGCMNVSKAKNRVLLWCLERERDFCLCQASNFGLARLSLSCLSHPGSSIAAAPHHPARCIVEERLH